MPSDLQAHHPLTCLSHNRLLSSITRITNLKTVEVVEEEEEEKMFTFAH